MIRHLHNLLMWQKFALVGVLALLMCALPAVSYLARGEIADTDRVGLINTPRSIYAHAA